MTEITCATDTVLNAKHLCFTARSIQLQLFAADDLIVVPTEKPSHPQTVVFPDFSYSHSFWQEVASLQSYSLTDYYPKTLIQETQRLLLNTDYQLQSVPPAYEAKIKIFWNVLGKILDPNLVAKITTITILATTIGTNGSFSFTQDEKSGNYSLICTARADLPIEYLYLSILEGIISCTQPGYTDLGTDGYEHRKAIAQIFKLHPEINHYISISSPQPLPLPTRILSKQYLKKIGYPEPVIAIQPDQLPLTISEKKVLLLFQNHPQEVITQNQIAFVLWEELSYEKFSLYAIADVLKSLRRKIKQQGINKEILFTIRGKGYLYLL